jgi:peptidylprolyl isomerase
MSGPKTLFPARPCRRPAALAAPLVALAMALGLGAAAAGCSSSTPTTSSSTTAAAGSGGGQPTTSATMQWSPAGTFGTQPTVVVPTGRPPSTLLSKDLIVGTGATAQSGSDVTVQYIGYSWTTRQEFDASWNRHQAFPFTLGIGQVIPGWDQGVAGMKVGGRRELVIPPGLAYGAHSPGAGIAANDTLIFVVDLVGVGSSTPTT